MDHQQIERMMERIQIGTTSMDTIDLALFERRP